MPMLQTTLTAPSMKAILEPRMVVATARREALTLVPLGYRTFACYGSSSTQRIRIEPPDFQYKSLYRYHDWSAFLLH